VNAYDLVYGPAAPIARRRNGFPGDPYWDVWLPNDPTCYQVEAGSSKYAFRAAKEQRESGQQLLPLEDDPSSILK